MNRRHAGRFAVALIAAFANCIACAQDSPHTSHVAANTTAMLPHSALATTSAWSKPSRPLVMRADAVSFTDEQLGQLTPLAPKTALQDDVTYASYNKTTPTITAQTVAPVVVRSPQQRFEIKSDDETLYLTLRRWTSESGHQLVWSATKDFPVKRTVYDAQEITSAIAQVMKDTELSAYPLHACAYTNNVIRVLHVSQSCIPK